MSVEGKVFHTEQIGDPDNGTYLRVWLCQPPPSGVRFTIRECEWQARGDIQFIIAIETEVPGGGVQ
jgi:hypothetical protein